VLSTEKSIFGSIGAKDFMISRLNLLPGLMHFLDRRRNLLPKRKTKNHHSSQSCRTRMWFLDLRWKKHSQHALRMWKWHLRKLRILNLTPNLKRSSLR